MYHSYNNAIFTRRIDGHLSNPINANKMPFISGGSQNVMIEREREKKDVHCRWRLAWYVIARQLDRPRIKLGWTRYKLERSARLELGRDCARESRWRVRDSRENRRWNPWKRETNRASASMYACMYVCAICTNSAGNFTSLKLNYTGDACRRDRDNERAFVFLVTNRQRYAHAFARTTFRARILICRKHNAEVCTKTASDDVTTTDFVK